MIHQIRFVGLLPFLFFLIISCKKDECADITFNQKSLDNISKSYESWEGVEAFIYRDSLGVEYRYDLLINESFIVDETIRDTCDASIRNISYKGVLNLIMYGHTDSTRIAFGQHVIFLEDENDLRERNLIDRLVISIFDDTPPASAVPLSRITLMTSDRQSSYSLTDFNNDQTNYFDELTILGKTFHDVFEQQNGTPKLYFTKDDGVVSFTDNRGVKLILERSE